MQQVFDQSKSGEIGEGVRIVDPLRDQRWNRFVERHPFGWVTHLSGWKRVLDLTFPHMRGYYLALEEGGTLKAALPVYSVESWLTGRRLVSIPFATLCDPLAADPAEMALLFDAAVNLSREIGVPRIKIKTLLASHLLDRDALLADCGLKHHFLRLDCDPDRVRRTFHRSCVRQRIARAEKSGLTLVRGACDGHLREFYLLHRLTRKRRGLPPHPFSLIRSMVQVFAGGKTVDLLLCYKEQRAIAGVIVFRYRDRVSIEYSAVDAAYNELSPVHFLFWNAIREACLSGYRILDFGQTSVHNKSLMDFKSHWGTEVADLPHFTYPNDPAYSQDLAEETIGRRLMHYVCNKAPGTALSYLGDICYRHLG